MGLCLVSFCGAQIGQDEPPVKTTTRANLGAKFRRGIFFNGTFNPAVKTANGSYYNVDVNEPDSVVHIRTVVSQDRLRTVDLTPKSYLVVPFAKVFHAVRGLFGFDPNNLSDLRPATLASLVFVTKEHWSIKQVQGEEEVNIPLITDVLAKNPKSKAPAFNITFGIANIYGEKNQLYAYIEFLNGACPPSGGPFMLTFNSGTGTAFQQSVNADKWTVDPIINPMSAQHKNAQPLLSSLAKPPTAPVDEFLVNVNYPLGVNLHFVGLQELSSNPKDTTAVVQGDFEKVIQNNYTISNGFQPVGFSLGAASNEAFTNKIIRGGMFMRVYSKRPLAGFIERSEYEDLYVPPFPVEKVGNMPWVGVAVNGSYIAERDKRISNQASSRFYSYVKPEASLVIDQLRGSNAIIPSGLGLDLDGKVWYFLFGRESVGFHVRQTESYAHALLTLKFGNSKGYFGFEVGSNEANGFLKQQGWVLGLNLQF